jgi:uncharacterized protein
VKNANLVSQIVGRVAFVLAVVLALGGCSKSAEQKVAPKTVSDYFSIKVGERTVRMQLAVVGPEQQRGLMQRRDLGPDEGMLFPYATPQTMSFWMHNTPTPLDIGYFDSAGVLLEIYAMHPFDETPVRSLSDAVKYALEVNQGWFRNNGVRPGEKIDLKAVAEALKARGFEPAEYGLQ